VPEPAVPLESAVPAAEEPAPAVEPAASEPEAPAAVPEPAVPLESAVPAAEEPAPAVERAAPEPEAPAAVPEPAVPLESAVLAAEEPAPAVKHAASEPAPPAPPEPAAAPAPAAPHAVPRLPHTGPHWLLSLYSPAADDTIDWRRGNYTVVARGGRIESPAGSGELKKQVRMLAEGSVVYAAPDPRGAAADVAPDGFAHPVFRAGFAVAIPLPEVS